MGFTYHKLWRLLERKGIDRKQFADRLGHEAGIIRKLEQSEPVSLEVLGEICELLECNIGDLIDYRSREEERGILKSIDLFAGIGGIRMGFDHAFRGKLRTVFVSEWDPKAQETYSANFPDGMEIHGDITKIKEEDVPAHDILLAGFPCQAFSMAGQRKGFEDARGTLFFDVARIAKFHKPKVIFCENVKNLTRHDRGKTFSVIVRILRDLGYKVFHRVLNSKNFGVPQNRERIYVVAFREDIAPEEFVFPESAGKETVIRDILEEHEVNTKYYLSTVYLKALHDHRARHEAKGHGFGYEIRDLDEVAGAIVCGGMGRERNLIVDKRLTDFEPKTHIKGEVNREYIRKMTPREWARLQGFPDDFKFVVSDTHLYKQFGNSVTVPVIEAIAKKVKEHLDRVAKTGMTDSPGR